MGFMKRIYTERIYSGKSLNPESFSKELRIICGIDKPDKPEGSDSSIYDGFEDDLKL